MNDLRETYLTKLDLLSASAKGIRHTTTLHGVPFDVSKSAVQKYARRGDFNKGVQYLIDVDTFGLITQSPPVKGIRTNMSNRILVISIEDCCDPNVTCKVHELISQWSRDRQSSDAMQSLISAYKLVCNAKKARGASIVKTFIHFEKGSERWKEKYAYLMDDGKKDLSFENLVTDGDLPHAVKYHLRGNIKIFSIWNTLEKVISNPFVDEEDKLLGRRRRVTIQRLRSYYETSRLKEKDLYLYFSVFIVCRRRYINFEVYPTTETATDIISMYSDVIKQNKSLMGIIDNYCIDKHTLIGRERGMSDVEFALSGSLCTNEVEGAILPEWLDMYKESKYL